MPKKKSHGPRYKLKSKPRAYVQRDKLGRFKKWTNWRRGTVIDATRKAKPATTPGYGHRKDYPRRKKPKPVGFFTKGKGKDRKVIPITTPSGKRQRRIVRVRKKVEKKPSPKIEKPKKVEKKSHVKIPKKKRARPKMMTHIERMHLLAACKKFDVDPQEVDHNISYYENKEHIQELAKMKGYSKAEITSEAREREEWTGQYKQYLSSLKSELEGAGYVVSGPEM